MDDPLREALSLYDLGATEATFIRHNENATAHLAGGQRNEEYIHRIHQPAAA